MGQMSLKRLFAALTRVVTGTQRTLACNRKALRHTSMYKSVLWGRILATGALFCLDGAACLAADRVMISVETRSPGAAISENALGLSYETSLMLPPGEGKRYFRPDNKPLVTM